MYAIVHRKMNTEIATDRDGRLEVFNYRPEYANKQDYKTVEIRYSFVRRKK